MYPEAKKSVFIFVLECPGICRSIDEIRFHHPTTEFQHIISVILSFCVINP